MPGCRVAVLLSGSGTTLQNFCNHIDNGSLNGVTIELVVSSKKANSFWWEALQGRDCSIRFSKLLGGLADAFGVERAKGRNIPTAVVESKTYRNPETKKTDWEAMSSKVVDLLHESKIDLVILAGYMCMFIVPPEYENRVMNIHPALIPAFSGQGMYGDKVHKAVIYRGVKLTGCTVHFVTNEYDAGPIILQKTCQVLANDTWEDVQYKVQALEKQAFPEAIFLYAAGRLQVKEGTVFISEAKEEDS